MQTDERGTPKPRRASVSPYALAVLVVAAFVAVLYAGACSQNNNPAIGGTGGTTTIGGGGGGTCGTPAPGCSCTTPGATAPCGSTISVSGNTVKCQKGTMECGRDDTWGQCWGTTVALPLGRISHFVLASDAGTCNDPCDPYCQVFSDTPGGV